MSPVELATSIGGRVDPGALARLSAEVAQIERELEAQVDSQASLVRSVGRHTLEAGGKRLRPALVSVCAAATGIPVDLDRVRRLGASMELIHMATLVHDDVIDESSSRRGRPTAAFEFGNTASVLSGDVLLAKAMRILAEDGDLAIIRCVSQGVVEMAEGEVRELAARGDFDLSESEHLDILQMKTASFIQTACEVGALAAGAPEATRKTLARYGRSMGMAFQIADDLLDYQGDPHRTGKPSAVDFREGCATLPLIFLRETLTSSERSAAAGWFGNGAMDENVERIRSWMAARGAFERTGAAAKAYVEEALSALRDLPETADKTLLSAVAEYVVGRSS